jgi:predicted transposase/invertase (TIGR01784 family)
MERRWLNPLADLVFKRIFGQEKEILIELINGIIQPIDPVIDIEYLSLELLPEGKEGKNSIVDVRCLDLKKRNFILEILLLQQISFQERVLYYASKTYGKQLLKGGKYEELQPVYLLSIMDYTFDHLNNDWLHRYSLINEIDINKKLNGIHLIFLELDKYRKIAKFTLDTVQDRWIAFLTQPEKILAMSKETLHDYPNLIKAVELLNESNYTPGQILAYEKYLDSVISWNSTMIESFDNGYDQGLTEGIEKGAEKTIAIMQELRNGNLTIADIAEKFKIKEELVLQLRDLL